LEQGFTEPGNNIGTKKLGDFLTQFVRGFRGKQLATVAWACKRHIYFSQKSAGRSAEHRDTIAKIERFIDIVSDEYDG
jgi:hypothetical protein